MKNVVILGAGTAGTIVANRLAGELPAGWQLRIIEPTRQHLFQPDLVFLPFGARSIDGVERPRAETLKEPGSWLAEGVVAVETAERQVRLSSGGSLSYDLLVVATGAAPRPELTPGILGERFRESVHEFYTLEGALALREAVDSFHGGRIVLDVASTPVKGPLAALEFLFLADAFFRKRDERKRTELVYATPEAELPFRGFITPLLQEKDIHITASFADPEVDQGKRTIRSADGREILFDLLVVVPTHGGAAFLGDSELGDARGFVPVHPGTLALSGHEGVFALGDATALDLLKTGSVAHFQAELVAENLLRSMRGEELKEGTVELAPMFVETGRGKALFADFGTDAQEEAIRNFPLRGLGPFTFGSESRRNHLGKLAMRWMYFNRLLQGKSLPGR